MNRLLSQYFVGVLCLVLLCAAALWYTLRAPDESKLQALTDEAASAVEQLESELRGLPVDQWWGHVDNNSDRERYWIVFGDRTDFATPTVALLSQGKTDASVDDEGYPFAQRFVGDTDQILTLSYRDEVIGRGVSMDRSTILLGLGSLLFIPALFAWFVLRPLRKRLGSLEIAAKGFASGNFSSRVPDDDSSVIGGLGSSFNSMATRLETLVSQNQTLLDDQREMLRAVAHEFRGPMARIRFALDMAQDADGRISPELHHDMGNGLDELDLLVGEVLSYARLQPGTPMLTLEAVHFDEVVLDAVSQAQIGNEGASITPSPGVSSEREIQADAYHLQRAVLNLINNAARHASGQVQVSWKCENDMCQVQVDDDGAGVPTTWRARIFDPFVRVDPSRSRNSGGAGLGLAIVSRIVEKHGGTAEVSDSPSLGGARFTMRWPASPPVA